MRVLAALKSEKMVSLVIRRVISHSALSLGLNQSVLAHCGSVLMLDLLQLGKTPLSVTVVNQQSRKYICAEKDSVLLIM